MKRNKILFLSVFLLLSMAVQGAVWPFGSSQEKKLLTQAREEYSKEEYNKAINTLELFLDKGTVKRREKRAYLLLGESYEKINAPQKALGVYLEGVELNPKDIELKIHLARLYETTGMYSRAISVYAQVYVMSPSSHEAVLGLGRCYSKEGFFSKAANYYALYLKLEKKPSADFWAQYAYAYYKQKLFNEALFSISMAIEKSPSSADYWFLSARINKALKNGGYAYEQIEHAITLNPHDETIYYTLIYWYIEAHNYDAAAVLITGNTPLDLYLKYMVENGRGNKPAAKKYLEKIVSFEATGFINDMATALLKKGK